MNQSIRKKIAMAFTAALMTAVVLSGGGQTGKGKNDNGNVADVTAENHTVSSLEEDAGSSTDTGTPDGGCRSMNGMTVWTMTSCSITIFQADMK